MKLAKIKNDGGITAVEVENGKELRGRHRTEAELLAAGFLPLCEIDGEGTCSYTNNGAFICQVWQPEIMGEGVDNA